MADLSVGWVSRSRKERGKAEYRASRSLNLFSPCDSQSRARKVPKEGSGTQVENEPQFPKTALCSDYVSAKART